MVKFNSCEERDAGFAMLFQMSGDEDGYWALFQGISEFDNPVGE